ncbi:MAG: hypothetical protein GY722_08250 [bacterium]|nr:hypothetical protein [bacterium]
MKRVFALLLAGAAVFAAVVLGEPSAPAGPDFEGPEERESVASSTASVWYCTWAASGALRDSTVMIAAGVPVKASLTLPQQIVGEEPDTEEVELDGTGAVAVDVGHIVRRGDTPLFVEFDDGPAAVTVVVESDELLTGDTCVARFPKVWELPGGTTREGRTLTLRLFNPFPELAKVTVGGSSESGQTGLIDLQGIDVEGRTWHDVRVDELVRLLDDVSLTVTTSEGFVIPSLVLAGTGDEASWPGIAPATHWEFPVANLSAEFASTVMLSNTGSASVAAVIDVYTRDGATIAAREVVIDPSIPKRVDLSDLADGAMGIRVRAAAPLSAVVLAEESIVVREVTDEEGQLTEDNPVAGDRIGGTIGTTSPALKWLLPGLGAVDAGESTVWLLNTGTEAATVILHPLGQQEMPTSKQSVLPGTVLGVPLGSDPTIGGYFVESSTPISISWSVEAPTGIMFVAGTVVGG